MENRYWADYNRVGFSLLSPLCKVIIKNPKEENLLKLQSLIDQISSDSLQLYQRYICIPLCVTLAKKDARLEIKRHVVDCLAKIARKTKINETDLFMRVFSEIFRVISDTSFKKTVPDCPEELKLSVMECATVLISSTSTKVLSELYSKQNLHIISHGIYFCLYIINEELYLDLRIAALKCLMHVCHAHNDLHSSNLEFRIKVGNAIMHCLPGIVLKLRKAICVDEKQNHRITMLAIKAWSRITAIVMEDNFTSENYDSKDDWVTAQLDLVSFMEKQKEETKNHGKPPILSEINGNQKTREWYTWSSKSMFKIVDEICHLYFSNFKVRQEMVSSAELLLLNCSRNMKECVPSLVELLLILSEDEVIDISTRSRAALSKFSEQFEKSLVEIMEDHFLKVMKKLCSSTQGEEDLKTHLNLVCGYLKLLGSNLKRITKSSIHLNTIFSALIRIISLDYFIVSPLEDWSLGTSDADILKARIPWKCFKNFKNKQIFSKFKEICQLLSQHSDVSTISDHLLLNFNQNPDDKKEITLIINEIFSNASECDIVVPIIKRIITSYLDPEVWEDIRTENTERNPDVKNSTIVDIRSRMVQACLLVEGLGMLGRIALSEKMKFSSLDVWFFRVCLYPILERTGHPCAMLSGAGTLAMAHISQATGMSIPAVIQNNSDYLTHHIVLKLRHSSELISSAPLNVLVAILEYATPDILINLEEAVTSVVDYGLKYENDLKVQDCLKCMHVFTKFVKKKFAKEKNLQVDKTSDNENSLMHENEKNIQIKNNLGIVTQMLLDYQRTRKIANSFTSDYQDFEKEPQDTEEKIKRIYSTNENKTLLTEESKPPLPKHVDLTIIVLKQCLTFISSKKKERKLMAMDILSEGIWIISDHSCELLPLVHKIWGPLSVQFTNTDPLIMNRAFHLLSVIAVVAKDFIRNRTLKKVLPSITKFLLNQANLSLKKDMGSAYRFSQAYKLQLSLLQGLGELAFNLEFQEQDLSEILSAAAPYLSNLQPQPLQDACITTYSLASKINQDIVWLKLAYMGNLFKNLRPPSEEFKLYQVPIQTQFGEEYQQNVSRLIQSIGCNS